MSVVSAPPVAVLEHNVEYEVALKVADELALNVQVEFQKVR